MKLLRPIAMVSATGFAMALSSCDKVEELVEKGKDLVGMEDEAESEPTDYSVDRVDEEQAKAIIAEEPRMVMVEFYTDT